MTEETTMDSLPADDMPEAIADDPQESERLALAIPAGICAALIGAVLWALFVYITQYQFGLVVIAIGALIGLTIRKVGRGSRPVFGIVGAACAALAWALGTIMCYVALLAQDAGRPFLEVFGMLGVSEAVAFALRAADIMDLVFLGIALWEGYKFAIKPDVY